MTCTNHTIADSHASIRRAIFDLQRQRDNYQTTLRRAKAAGRKAGAKLMRQSIRDCNAQIDYLRRALGEC